MTRTAAEITGDTHNLVNEKKPVVLSQGALGLNSSSAASFPVWPDTCSSPYGMMASLS